MNCFRCGTPLTQMDVCTGCKADVRVNKRILRRSNSWYNEGLKCAKVRNLSGAKVCLQKSLKYNKANIGARNLLGLIFYETGRVVEALNEWNISQEMQPMVNPATRYLGEFAQDPHALEKVRQSVMKYNTAVNFAMQNSEDLAVIQLNKALALNNHMVDAYKLLGLIYINRKEYVKARKVLRKAHQIDNGDTDILAYIREAREQYNNAVADMKKQPLIFRMKYALSLRKNKVFSELEDSNLKHIIPNVMYVLTGIVIGLGIALFLILPAEKERMEESFREKEEHLYMTLAIPDVTPSPEPTMVPTATPSATALPPGVTAEPVDAVLDNAEVFGSRAALQVGAVTDDNEFFNQGTAAWDNQDYAGCIQAMQKVLVVSDTARDRANYMNALYYLGRCYEELVDKEKALAVFTKIVELYPDSSMQETAQYHINELNNQ